VSILDYEAGPFNDYKHLHVTLDDDPNENVSFGGGLDACVAYAECKCLKILEHLPNTTKFIDDALSHGGAVFVHCAMGKSRSATVVMAYLMQKYGRSVDESLEQLREGRGVCGPNPGFMEQLHVYYHMLHAKEQSDADRIYSEWLKSRDTQRDWYSYQRQQSAAKL
jgi:dual specificity phosphatase 12